VVFTQIEPWPIAYRDITLLSWPRLDKIALVEEACICLGDFADGFFYESIFSESLIKVLQSRDAMRWSTSVHTAVDKTTVSDRVRLFAG
jgi:hypothetical protein